MLGRLYALRWWMIGLITIGTIFNYLTRSLLGVAITQADFQSDLGMGAQEYSWVQAIFQAGLLLQPLAGYLLDAIGLKMGFGLFAMAWAVLTALHGAAMNWQMLAVFRGLMGFAEGTAQPGGMKAVAEWFPTRERGFAAGFYNIGASFGPMLAAPLMGFAVYLASWRVAFVIAGGAALVWVAMWFRYYYSPKQHPKITPEERNHIESNQEAHLASDEKKPSLLALLKQRNTWGIAIPRLLADPTWGTLTFWMPLYFATERGFDIKQIALYTWLPFLTADIGAMTGPTIAFWLQKRGLSLVNARRTAFTVGAVLMTSMLFVAKVADPYAALALLCLGAFAHQTLSITVITMSSDLFRKNEVATVAGVAGFCGNFGVMVFTLVVGGLVKVIGFDPFFVALSMFDILAAIWLWTVVRERKEPPVKAAA